MQCLIVTLQLCLSPCQSIDLVYDELAEEDAKAGYQNIVDERREAYRAGKSTRLK